MSWDLLGDIGGTHMRLAEGRNGRLGQRMTFPTVGDVTPAEAIAGFVEKIGTVPNRASVAGAGIVENGAVTLTNTGTRISERIVREASGAPTAKILNDFEAAAWSLCEFDEDHIERLQGHRSESRGVRLIIGLGTGLGVGALVWHHDTPLVVQSEGGHVRLSPGTAEEVEIFRRLGALWPEVRMGEGHGVEAEAILSGTGLPVLHRAVAQALGHPAEQTQAADILAEGRSDSDPVARKTTDLFLAYLGGFAGDMAVTFAAKGGVFLAGGVIAANRWIFEEPAFLNAFNSGGRHSDFRKGLSVFVLKNDDFGLQGALNYLRYDG